MEKNVSGTHPHGIYIIIILYSETRSKTVFLLSFITDLWTPRNVALVTLTPQVKNSSRAPVNEHDDDDDDNVRRLIGTGWRSFVRTAALRRCHPTPASKCSSTTSTTTILACLDLTTCSVLPRTVRRGPGSVPSLPMTRISVPTARSRSTWCRESPTRVRTPTHSRSIQRRASSPSPPVCDLC